MNDQIRLIRLARIEALFAAGPDTPSRTTWRPSGHPDVPPTECVEVPVDDLRQAFEDDKQWTQRNWPHGGGL